MLDQIKFWQIPIGTLKDKIRRCKCGKRVYKKTSSECLRCHTERVLANKKYKKRKQILQNKKASA